MASLSRRERERQTRRAEILTAAERIFQCRGFGETSMDEIAKESQFTKRTVYQYFASKEDLYFAVVVLGLERLQVYLSDATGLGGTGLQKVRRMASAYYMFSRDCPDAFRLINRAQHVRAHVEESANYREVGRLGSTIHEELSGIIGTGQMDGSIRPDLPPKELAFSLFLIVTGFFYRLHEVGETYTRMYGLSPDELASFAMGLVEDALIGGAPSGQ